MTKVAVIGLGYVGFPLAEALSNAGHEVFGIDINQERINEIKLDKFSKSFDDTTSQRTRLELTTSFDSLELAEVVIICVPTPLNQEGNPDLTALVQVSREIADKCCPGTLIINESTSFPGTLRNVIYDLVAKESQHGSTFEFASAPERINPGSDFHLSEIPRVIGGITKSATERAARLYREITNSVYIVDSPEIAELSKLLENSYRFINISFINEFHRYCLKFNINTSSVIEAASTKPFGFQAFYPGAGIGGHCIPVDPIYLYEHSASLEHPLNMIESARLTEISTLNNILGKFQIELSDLGLDKNARILVYGVTYKDGVADIRESAGIKILTKLTEMGYEVYWFDPLINHMPKFAQMTNLEAIDAVLITNSNPSEVLEKILSMELPVWDTSAQFKTHRKIGRL